MYEILSNVSKVTLNLNGKLLLSIVIFVLSLSPGYFVYIINAVYCKRDATDPRIFFIIALSVLTLMIFVTILAASGDALNQQVSMNFIFRLILQIKFAFKVFRNS